MSEKMSYAHALTRPRKLTDASLSSHLSDERSSGVESNNGSGNSGTPVSESRALVHPQTRSAPPARYHTQAPSVQQPGHLLGPVIQRTKQPERRMNEDTPDTSSSNNFGLRFTSNPVQSGSTPSIGSHTSGSPAPRVYGAGLGVMPSTRMVPQCNMVEHTELSALLGNAIETGGALEKERARAEAERARLDVRYEFAVEVAMHHLHAKDSEITRLKAAIEAAGLGPIDAPLTDANLEFFKAEFDMFLRLMCNWAKRFYKFPTNNPFSDGIRQTLVEACGNEVIAAKLVTDVQFKHLVVINIAMKYLLIHILNCDFLKEVAADMGENMIGRNAFSNLMNRIRNDTNFGDRIYERIHIVATKHAEFLIEHLNPLLSRIRDPTHGEQTLKQFTAVTQHAGRVQLELVKRSVFVEFNFAGVNELFSAATMQTTNGDNVGLNINRNETAALGYELRGAQIQMCVLPEINIRVCSEDGSMRFVNARKADALLFYP